MVAVVVIFSLLSSLFNAVSAVIQRKVAGSPSAKELFTRRFMRTLVTNKWWLIGALVQVIGFLFQAVALWQGSLILVAPLLTSDLVFLMLIMHFYFRIPTGKREWGAVAAICLGLSGLLFTAHPVEGELPFSASPWPVVLGTIGGLLIIGAYLVRRLSSSRVRAGMIGIAAGLSFSLVSIFTKLSTHQLESGIPNLLTSWPLYALLFAGLLSFLFQQNTYGAGPLATSQPAMEITEPVASVAIGILLFGDMINTSPSTLAGELISSVVIIAGIVMITGSKRVYQSQL